MRYLLESMYLRPITRAGVMCKERGRRMRAGVMSQEPRQRIWILRDVMMTEFEIPPRMGQPRGHTCGGGFELLEFRTLVGRRGRENVMKLNST